MTSKNIFFTLFTVLIFAQNINAMHCKNKLLRQLINKNSTINISQQKNNVLRLYGQRSSKEEPIVMDVPPLLDFGVKFVFGTACVGFFLFGVSVYGQYSGVDPKDEAEFEAIRAEEEAKSAAFKAKMSNDPHWQQWEDVWAEQDAAGSPSASNCCCKCASCKCARSSGGSITDFA